MTATKPTAVEYTVGTTIFTIKPSGGRWVLLNETGDVLLKSRSYDKCVAHANETVGTPVAPQQEPPASQPEAEAKEPETFSLTEEIEKREMEVPVNKETSADQPKVKETKPSKPKKAKVSAPNSETVAPNSVTHHNGVTVSEKRPGVLAVMVRCLRAASEKHPVTKESVLDVLCNEFPDRDRNKMKATLAMQMPAGLRYEKKIVLASADVEVETQSEVGGMLVTGVKKAKGYWIDEEATKAEQGK